MSVRVVYEVRQRNLTGDSRELGMFTDDAMADQAIQHLYREAWKTVLNPAFEGSAWFSTDLRDVIVVQGYDTWAVDDWNSASPTFYKVPHKMWNQVPSSVQNFVFTMDGVDFF